MHQETKYRDEVETLQMVWEGMEETFLVSRIQPGNKVTFVDEPKVCDYTNLPALGEIDAIPLQ